MSFKRFKLYQSPEEMNAGEGSQYILLNLDQIVSIKPINIPTANEVIHAYWIRLTNGKKYKAVEMPLELETLLESTAPFALDSEEDTIEFQ